MKSFVGIPTKLKLAIKFFFIIMVFLYFIFHAINGENGMRSYVVIKRQLAEQTEINNKLKTEAERLERDVRLLSNKTLDIDILEERCRNILNYSYPGEIILEEDTIR